MGNHYHVVVRFDAARQMDQAELRRRALALYPKSQELLATWTEDKWQRFNRRLFDVSELMRNVQQSFTKWFNKRFDRRGRLWADRFKSTLLEPGRSVVDCMLYVDLNPVRAGLVQRPEDHLGTSIYYRSTKKGRWLAPLKQLVGEESGSSAMRTYRSLLYHRGAVPTKLQHAKIPQAILDAEIARGFDTRGIYTKRLRYFVDGIAVGSATFVQKHLSLLCERGQYLRRQHPVIQHDVATLREQRSHAVVF
jgi:hypothetical protein